METSKYDLSISSDLLSLFNAWHNPNFSWIPEDDSAGLQIQGNMVKTIQFVESKMYHSSFMNRCIGDIGLHQFELRFKGRLDGRTTTFTIGVIDQDYGTPSIDEAKIGDCKHSASFVMNHRGTCTYHDGVAGSLRETVNSLLKDDAFFMFEVRNVTRDA